jgi:hypothetical protein
VNIGAGALVDGAGINTATVEYFGWLGLVREKYIDHLTDCIEEYPILMKRLGILVGKNDRETLRDMMAQVWIMFVGLLFRFVLVIIVGCCSRLMPNRNVCVSLHASFCLFAGGVSSCPNSDERGSVAAGGSPISPISTKGAHFAYFICSHLLCNFCTIHWRVAVSLTY